MSERASIADIKALLQRDVEGLARRLAPDGYRSGRYWVARNPTRDDHKPGSFWIILSGTSPGVWKEEASGETGDVIAFVKYCLRFEKLADALDWARDWLGLSKGPVNPKVLEMARADTARRKEQDAKLAAEQLGIDRKRAHALWLNAERDIRGTAVEAYLEHRGIDIHALPRLPGAIRALASHRHRESETAWPAMVAVMSAPGIPFAAVHRTWLARDGRGKAPVTPTKKIWPSFTGAAIHLARGETGLPAEDAVKRGMVDRLLVCEGIEDGLSVAMAAPDLRVWAVGTLGNLAHVKIPDCCHEVIVAADNDWGKPQAEALLKRGLEALAAQRRPVRVARAAIGKDFNDQLRGAA